MKLQLLLSLLIAAAATSGASARAKLDLTTSNLINPPATHRIAPLSPGRNVGLMVMVGPSTTRADLEQAGAKVMAMAGRVAAVSIPVEDISHLAETEGVEYISCGIQNPSLYEARIYSNANPAIDATDGFHTPYTGKGIVTGLMDIGIDPNHINFIDSETGTSRVKAVYHFIGDEGGCRAYLTPEAIASFETDTLTTTHGTHTCGIMAGGYRGEGRYGLNGTVTDRSNPYYGLASTSDIVMAAGPLYDANICGGVEAVIEYAESEGKPAVVNLSLGSPLGPHDGTDPVAQFLAQAGTRAVICLAAGNDGEYGGAISKSFTASDIELKSILRPRTTGYFAFELWNSTSAPIDLEIVVCNVKTGEIVASYPLTVSDEVVDIDSSTEGIGQYLASAFTSDSGGELIGQVYPANNRYYIQAALKLQRQTPPDYTYAVGFRVKGTEGTTVEGNSSLAYFSSSGLTGWSDGEGMGSISSMATGDNVIVVGGYTTSQTITRLTGAVYDDTSVNQDKIYQYTSYGAGKGGRMLPDFCAPAANINSSISRYWTGMNPEKVTGVATRDDTDYYWGSDQGTSMATPYVAGTCAMMLEADPTLTVNEIRDIIAQTADTPEGDLSADERIQWGAGKVNTSAAVMKVISISGAGSITADPDRSLMISRASNGLNILVAGATTVKATLTNLQGTVVATQRENGDTLTLTDPAAHGIYILTITTPGATFTRKVAI